MIINFRQINGLSASIDVGDNATAEDAKMILSGHMNIHQDKICLIYGGMELKNENNIVVNGESNIRNDSFVFVLDKTKMIKTENIPDSEETSEDTTDSISEDSEEEDEKEENIPYENIPYENIPVEIKVPLTYENEIIHVTQEEFEDIEDIKGFGFPEEKVIKYYIASEKNKQFAVDMLLNEQT